MAVRSSHNIYTEIITITDRYLGPASERFVHRQIRNHLGKEPQQLAPQDLPPLINWIQATIAVLTDDDKVIEDYVTELKQLAGSGKRTG